ncbi:MAG: pyridoxamine 5'-phosphate oxidase family protein [Chloroflexi bacterium]|nr:pyridoxamine 5'-phosphate oxidase family protein [Chloroflexota bacterium]MCI0644097.1 pyridoxamine 5'-phosphate oxidase family protein [Chloroflexota bacterium]
MHEVFHEGELAVQLRAGVKQMAQRVGRMIKTTIPFAAQEFLSEQSFAAAATIDSAGWVWASLLVGPPGFMTADEQTVHISPIPLSGDPLVENLRQDRRIGLVVIDFATRRRMRLNGQVEMQEDGALMVRPQEVYANCPKYIQVRTVDVDPVDLRPVTVSRHDVLTAQQQAWIRQADTFFIATAYPQGNADASHRGGNPGFVTVPDPGTLIWPDYAGNMLFNTLGNIQANPRTGLLFLDFATGSTLQIIGEAHVVWDEEQLANYRGAERLVTFKVRQVVESGNRFPRQWRFHSYSPHNP